VLPTERRAAALAFVLTACAGTQPAPPAPEASAPAPAPVTTVEPEIAATSPRYGPEPRVAATSVEARAADAVRARFPGARTSGALALAARDLARRAAEGDASLGRDRLRAALARGLSYDAAPAAYSVAAGRDNAPAALQHALPSKGRASHFGVGAWEDGERVWLVLLTADRKAALSPFPRDVPAGATAVLSGRLEPPLLHPRVFVTQPTGEVWEAPVSGSRAFQARVPFPGAGRYLVEVVAQSGPGGPEVAALLTVSAGGADLERAERAAGDAEPTELLAAEARVVELVNDARRARGLPPLSASPDLAAVARAHSARMLEQRTLAHVLPGSGDLGERLRGARVSYARALENVAVGGSTLAAHEAAEESPAHLGNILAPRVTLIGVGAARGAGAGGRPVVYLTEIFVEPPSAREPGAQAPSELRVREILWSERARARQAPLTADARLDALAREAAERMRRAGSPEAGEDLAQRALGLGRKISAVDVFVASRGDDAARSANVRDGRFRRVGVGVAVGDSARFGVGRLFIAVVFTD
jgi:uncharacterized protein YkwD